MSQKFFNTYFEYIGDTEAPIAFHRWAILSCIAASLGRKCYVPLGHYKIYPNMYTMLIGSSGTRKSTSINSARKLLKKAGYDKFAADKTSKEKFIADLMDRNYAAKVDAGKVNLDAIVMDTVCHDAEAFIVSDEFQDFLGQNNLDFITTLGKLWDVLDSYEHRIKSGRSVVVERPVVNILGGNTPTGFSFTFPPEIVGQGFLSRLLLIYGEGTGKKIAWPKPVNMNASTYLIPKLQAIMAMPPFQFSIKTAARDLLETIYTTHISINDPRFSSYETRRHVHMLKLCGILCILADRGEPEITVDDVLEANTMLYYAERQMPLALGEFGKGRFSEVSNSVVEALQKSPVPLGLNDLWKHVAQDLTNLKDLVDIIRGLQSLDKLQQVQVKGEIKFLPKRNRVDYFDSKLLRPDFLTKEEQIIGGYDL